MEQSIVQINELLNALEINKQQQLKELMGEIGVDETDKKLRKKIKKYAIDKDDLLANAIEKLHKNLDQLSKYYEGSSKAYYKLIAAKKLHDKSIIDRDKSQNDAKINQNIHEKMYQRYKEQVKKAEAVSEQQQKRRKEVYKELQVQIKEIQEEYEKKGQMKIQKAQENQILKHQINQLEPHLKTSQTIYDAQLKKKSIQIEINMTTLKKKVQTMSSFMNMKQETDEKLIKSKQVQRKLEARLKTLNSKEDEHKVCLAKAHLSLESYKNCIKKLKDEVPKIEREAMQAKDKVARNEKTLEEIRDVVSKLDQEIQKEHRNIEMLNKLEANLRTQLQTEKLKSKAQ